MVNKLDNMFTQAGYIVKQYASDDQIDVIVRDKEYGLSYPYFCFGLSFQNSGNNYKYNLRFNITNNPTTT